MDHMRIRCIHHFKSDLINNMDHMRISGTESSPVILLDEMILKQVNASARLNSELENVKLEIHDLVKGKLSPFLITPYVNIYKADTSYS